MHSVTTKLRLTKVLSISVSLISFCVYLAVGAHGMNCLAQTPSQAAAPPVNGGLPVVSPDNSHIVFISDRDGMTDLYLISIDGTGETRLTKTPDHEGNLGWSADGKRILFSIFEKDVSHLYAIDPDGRNQREIAIVNGRGPMISPRGKRLLFMAGTWTATRLMVSALDGSKSQQITDGSSIAWNSHWSPDSKRIAYTGRSATKSELAVFVMNADGTAARKVTNIAPEEGGAQWPVWSPDGTHLAVQVNNRTKKNSAHIWIVNVATGAAQKLASHDEAYLDETPSWFPDGKRIAFQSNRTGKMEVWIMNADGTGPCQVSGVIAGRSAPSKPAN